MSLPLRAFGLSIDLVVATGTIRVGYFGIGVVLRGVQLLTIMDVRVVTCLNITILATSPFARILIMIRWAVENGWRVRIWTSYL